MPYKAILGILAAIISFIAYIPYLRDVFKHKTKPHIFTWFVWSFIVGLGFMAQIKEGAGYGAWVTGVTAIICFSIAILSFSYGEKDIKKTDWLYFILAILGLIGWRLTNNPLVAIIMVILADVLAFIPTMHKGYNKPYEETLSTWGLNSLKFTIALIALESYSLTTYLYPATLIITNGAMALILLVRRKNEKINIL